jgi:hypothetical protein
LEGFAAAFLLAAAAPFARWGNESSSGGWVALLQTSPGGQRFAPGAGDEFRSAPLLQQRNSSHPVRVPDMVMITGAVVFGMVGVAVGFTWEYVFNRER